VADTRRTWAQLAVLFADNTAGAISPQDLRDGFASLQPHVAATAPTVSDDETAGFDVDHAWFDTSTTPDSLYRCLSPTTGAAVWAKVYPVTASVAWGAITGTLADQTDLQAALDGKAAASHAHTQSFIIAASDETTDLTTGTAKVTFRMPYAFTVSAVRASVTTAPTGANLEVDINEGGASILSTILSIDAGEKTSTTAATAAVISDSSLADDAEITIDIDQVGSTVAGAGLKVTLIGTKT